MKVNYKSDFDFLLKLKVADEDIGFPVYDWTATLFTDCPCGSSYVASSVGGVLTNCTNDRGQIHIFCDNHRLGKGTLNVSFEAINPDVRYADGNKKVVHPEALDIELIEGDGDDVTSIEVETSLNAFVISAYDVAKKYGYTGTQEEYNSYLAKIPDMYSTMTDMTGVVKYSEAQDLTPGQQKVARDNIKVYSTTDVDTKVGNIDILLELI